MIYANLFEISHRRFNHIANFSSINSFALYLIAEGGKK
jgi:hypothetical protein